MSRNVGYWQSWSVYRDESCNLFTPESIDASSYTHIVYSFAAIARDGTLDAWNSTEEIERINLYKRFLDVKDKYPTTKFAGECCSSKNTSRNICYIFLLSRINFLFQCSLSSINFCCAMPNYYQWQSEDGLTMILIMSVFIDLVEFHLPQRAG